MSKGTLSDFLKNKNGDNSVEINEDMLKEMCNFSNRSTSTNVKFRSENGSILRKNGGGL
jgi:hypothetical protein